MSGPVGDRPLRVAVLTGPFTATQDAQLTALRERTGATVEIVYRRSVPDAPYDYSGFSSLSGALGWDAEIPSAEVNDLVDRLQPDVVFVTSWNYGVYVRIARAWRHRALRVMLMDNPWRATAKQWGGVAISRLYLQPSFDVAFLPNERQRVFARKLGFRDEEIWEGVYCCDHPRFQVNRSTRVQEPRVFLYVGRLVDSKGVDVLLRGYHAYRNLVEEPWPLHVAGAGPLEHLVSAAEGVVTLGFRQPAVMPQVFADAGCFVLPSTFEPWGIVVHEAATSGLPIICTTACGASLDLVRDGYNGYVVAPSNAQALTDAMASMTLMATDRRRAMAAASVSLSNQLTPQRWADSFEERARGWLERNLGAGQLGRDLG